MLNRANSEFPTALYSAAGVRALDAAAIASGIPGATLMERAGRHAFNVLRYEWPTLTRLAVICGTGNNGGDGYVIARLAQQAGLQVTVLQIGATDKVKGDAFLALQALTATGITPIPFTPAALAPAELLVDALMGTGLDRPLQGDQAVAVQAINASGRPVLAVDIPTGLHADTGRVLGVAVKAEITVTFIGLKCGLLTAEGPEQAGRLAFSNLEVPAAILASGSPVAQRIGPDLLCDNLRRRSRSAHKGHFGHVLVVGGDHGYAGAARMAAEAAARVGAGLVSLATRADHAALLSATRPELMAHGVETPAELRPLLRQASVVAVGPGLGRSAWAKGLLAALLESALPMVIDADALNLLAENPVRLDNAILTPHPGEAARLLAVSTASIQDDRFAAARDLQQRYGGVCVLKGAGTLIVAGAGLAQIATTGNPGMASGGMGDVLTGVIAGLLAQGTPAPIAAALGVWLHGRAADEVAAMAGERGTLATDLLPVLRTLVNPEHAAGPGRNA